MTSSPNNPHSKEVVENALSGFTEKPLSLLFSEFGLEHPNTRI